MWELPWWVVLIGAWGAGSVGFLLAAILSLGKFADEATERIYVDGMNGGLMCNRSALTGIRHTSGGSMRRDAFGVVHCLMRHRVRCRYGLWTPRRRGEASGAPRRSSRTLQWTSRRPSPSSSRAQAPALLTRWYGAAWLP